MEKTLLKTEQTQTRDEVAAYLQRVVDKLQSGETIALQGGGESVSLDVPDQLEFEVQVEEESSSGELSLEFELEWNGSDAGTSDQLDIS